MEADAAGLAAAAAAVVVVVAEEAAWPDWPSTGFLERWRPLFIWRSQYFWSATASLEHRHFFPSVLRQRPGSGSVLENPKWKAPHPTAHKFTLYTNHYIRNSESNTNQKNRVLAKFRTEENREARSSYKWRKELTSIGS